MAGLLGTAALLAAGAPVAAAPVSFSQVACNAHLVTANVDVPIKIDFTFEAQAPASAAPGDPLTVTIPADTSDLPATNSGQTVSQYVNVGVDYGVTGGSIDPASVTSGGDTTINGTVTPATATATADTLATNVPGPVPPGTLATPAISFNVIGTTAGTNVVVSVKSQHTTATVANIGDAAVTCPINGVLATTEIVAAGAPTAVDDKAETQPGQSVTIDVRANDSANPDLALDESKFAITTAPTKGTAVITDGKIVYTPNAGVAGTTDTLVYTLCSVPGTDGTQACDTATVTITIAAAQQTTAAPAASDQLPRTGGDALWLTLAGVGFVVVGLAFARQSKTAVRRP